MAWWTGLGEKLTNALAKGLDLLAARLLAASGSLKSTELEIQRRVPDLPPPAAAALLGHVSRAREAAIAMTAAPAEPFEDLERIPVNELLGPRFDPTDRFLYLTEVQGMDGEEDVTQPIAMDVASPVALSLDELSDIAGTELENRANKTPDKIVKPGRSLKDVDVDIKVRGIFRIY